MAPPPQSPSLDVHSAPRRAFRVLITGFGPFRQFKTNPSWLAVKPLQNTTLSFGSKHPSEQDDHYEIHISAFQMPVTYDAVLENVPKLHLRPPVLPKLPLEHPVYIPPEDAGKEGEKKQAEIDAGSDLIDEDEPFLPLDPPPADGYDFILHVGVGGKGGLKVERLGHKSGYQGSDAAGKMAEVVAREPYNESKGEKEKVIRGFGVGYEGFEQEIHTGINVDKLVASLKESGIEHIDASNDAGRYLCDFIYYCSLAESKRTVDSGLNTKGTPTLFLHCPPIGEPLETKEVTEGIQRIVTWVCKDLAIQKQPKSQGISGATSDSTWIGHLLSFLSTAVQFCC
ncbi:peptidase C15, pyroglutamyl peptidase I-like protein [Pluteus cervinus]|uniref:Peptidase C15, pyroglutamyl peptidase I-like protein n=1 Tax=Pluteus cervinus TaxID=181527 RepID=A0ACD3AKD9_9AGAR|nr:peptidase C15, pyroglutamyl peptidase I-like protein [Pluteus cervinus]